MKTKLLHSIVLTGGGTAGHCMPCVYLIPELARHFDNIFYIGSKTGIEKQIADKNQIPYFAIPTCKLERGKVFSNLKIPFVLMQSIANAKKILRTLKPDVVFSKGGFVSLPVCIAAYQLNIPVVSHESDFSLGLANKIILKKCDIMCTNYSEMADSNVKMLYTGPILPPHNAVKMEHSFTLNKVLPTLLIFGGSQGSAFINDAIMSASDELCVKYNIIHLVGKGNGEKYKSHGNYNSMEYCYDMATLYALADVVIGRAGAGTIFESLYEKKPLILIPLENKNSRGDQVQNAEYFAKKNVCVTIRQSDYSKGKLFESLDDINVNMAKYKKNIESIKLPNGISRVTNVLAKYKIK